MSDEIKMPLPDKELLKDDAYKAAESTFMSEMFDNENLSRNRAKPKEGDPDITFPEETPATPPAGETPAEPPKEGEKKETPPDEAPKSETDALLPGGETPAAPAAPAATPAADPAQPATPVPAAAAPAIDPDDIADRVADRLKPKPTQAAPPADPFAAYNDEEKDEIKALQALNKSGKYVGRDLVKETTTFWAKEQEYIAKWRKENPGKRYEADSEEHEDFYSGATPDIKDKDIENAHIEIRASEIAAKEVEKQVSQRMAPIEQKIKETERVTLEQKVTPIIADGVNRAMASLVMEAVPEFKDVIKDGRLTKEALATMSEKDPAAVQAINREARTLRVVVEECERMSLMPDHFQFNEAMRVSVEGSSPIRPHAEIIDTAHELEDSIMRGPKENRAREGRQFIPTALFTKKMDEAMQANNQALIDRLQNNFWIIGPDDIKQALVQKSAQKVKGILEIANTRGAASGKASPKQGETPPPAKPKEGTVKREPATPPSLASSSDNTDSRIPKAAPADSQEKIIERGFFGS
jgi:hypothetical protein